MRFGHFFYPMNFGPSRDYQSIETCLDEAGLVERLGFDAIWIAEPHFWPYKPRCLTTSAVAVASLAPVEAPLIMPSNTLALARAWRPDNPAFPSPPAACRCATRTPDCA